MTTLTDAQIAEVRAKSGDKRLPYIVDDTLMQAYFDNAAGDVPTTIVKVLEDRWADAEADVARLADGGSAVDRTEMDHIERLLKYWRGRAGIADNAVLRTGVLDIGIDSTDETGEWS